MSSQEILKSLCTECDPYPSNAEHHVERFDGAFYALTLSAHSFFARIRPIAEFLSFFERVFEKVLFYLLIRFRILRESVVLRTDSDIPNRTLVVAVEAEKRGMRVMALRSFGRPTNFFSIEHGGKKEYFESLPHIRIGAEFPIDLDDKALFKDMLTSRNMPCARGHFFRNTASAVRYVQEEIGFPVVVKPRRGSLSRHTVWNINDEQRLEMAVRNALLLYPECVVEEHVDGRVYRITLVDGAMVAACWREPANIVGDGVHTVRELIVIKNDTEHRGEIKQKNSTLHEIFLGSKALMLLAQENLTAESVLVLGKKVYVHDKVVLAAGIDIHDATDDVHPENVLLFQKVAALFGMPVIGIDFIISDISRSYTKERSALLEANPAPYIDMHYFPTTGKERNVAGAILDWYVADAKNR